MDEAPHCRSYFYVGGQYITNRQGQHVLGGQMYVEHLTPVNGPSHPWPLVFIPGAGQTGTNWLNTPDGRTGWGSWLLNRGYTVYLVDPIHRARSACDYQIEQTRTYPAELCEKRFTACREFKLWQGSELHTQWPGSGRMGDTTFDAYYASTVPCLADHTLEQQLMQAAGARLLDRIGLAILISHSQGGTHGWLWADARPELVKAIVALEPSGPPFSSSISNDPDAKKYGLTDIPLTFDPPLAVASDHCPVQQEHQTQDGRIYFLQREPARILPRFTKIPILLVTAEASSHNPYDNFTVKFLQQAKVEVEHLKLAEVGIHGNGHLFFLERNNLDIIETLQRWIENIE